MINSAQLFLLAALAPCVLLQFASHQLQVQAESNPSNLSSVQRYNHVSLPTAYPTSFARNVVIAGMVLTVSREVNFHLELMPNFTETACTIRVRTNWTTQFSTIKIFMIVNNQSDWVYSISDSHQFVLLNGNSSATTQAFTVSSPLNLSSGSYQAICYLTSYYSFSLNATVIAMSAQATISSPTQISVQSQRQSPQQILVEMFFVVVLVDTGLVNSFNYAYHFEQKPLDQVLLYSGNFTSSLDLNIPQMYQNSAFGGYDGHCIFGYSALDIGYYPQTGNGAYFYFHFDVTTAPFNFNVNLAVALVGYLDYLFNLQVICLAECGDTTFLQNNSCVSCSSGCKTCTNATVCLSCSQYYGLTPANLCQGCLALSPNCQECLNGSYCTSCSSSYYLLNSSSNLCQACSSWMPNCQQCQSESYCISCIGGNFSYVFFNNSCPLCSQFIDYCLTCINTALCTQCINSSFALNLVDWTCQPCSVTLDYCAGCTYSTACEQCENNSFVLAPDSTCQPCSAFIVNCLLCPNTSSCLQCQPTYVLLADLTCQLCNATLDYCEVCLNYTSCSSCMSFTHFLHANGTCQPCTLLPNCSQCSDESTCVNCLNETWGEAQDGSCQLCQSLIPNCVLCSNRTSCIGCTNASFALSINSTCESCSTFLEGCSQCLNSSFCTACINNSLAIHGNGSCWPCSLTLSYCVLCPSVSTCISCINSSYTIDMDGRCSSCSTLQANCLQCVNASYCTVCVSDQFYLFPTATTQYCFSCSLSIPHCISCLNSSSCTLCLSPSHYISALGQCQLCAQSIPSCINCSIDVQLGTYACLACENGTFANSSQLCQSCSTAISNCLNCLNQSHCDQCVSNLFIHSASNQCQLCSNVFPYCQECTATQCTQCMGALINQLTECACETGRLVSGLCTAITGCIAARQEPGGPTICIECNYTLFHPQPVDGLCSCLTGSLINEVCTVDDGCIVPIVQPDGSTRCQFCNVTAHFNSLLNAQGQCQCQPKYQLQGQICAQICGDGFLLPLSLECDDGNTIDGDGCSSLCTVENGFKCHNGSAVSASICVYEGLPLNISLRSIQRAQDADQGVFQFDIYPPLITISRMHLQSHVVFSCNASYTVSSILYFNGELQIQADYTTDLEGENCTISFSFDPQIIVSPPLRLHFQAVSQNIPLRVTAHQTQFSLLKKIFQILSYVVLGSLALTLPHKMIGAQLISCCQLVYLSNILYREPSFLFSSVKSFGLVTGYWSLFFNSSDKQMLVPFSRRVQLAPTFLQSSLIVVGILVFLAIMLVIIGLVSLCSSQTEIRIERKRRQKAEAAANFMYQHLVFPLVAGFFMVLTLSSFVNNLRLASDGDDKFSAAVNSLANILVYTYVGFVFLSQFAALLMRGGQQYDTLGGCVGAKKWYVPLFLMKLSLLSFLVSVDISCQLSFINFVLISVAFVHLLVLILGRPYSRVLHNIGAITCQLVVLEAFTLPFVQYFIAISESLELFLIYILQALIVLASVFALLRAFVSVCCEGEDPKGSDAQRNKKRRGKRELTKFQQFQLKQSKEMKRFSPFRYGNKKTAHNKKQARPAKLDQAHDENEILSLKQKLKASLISKKKKFMQRYQQNNIQ